MTHTSLTLKRLLICLVVILLTSSCQWFEKPPEHKYDPDELIEDFDFLTDKLAEMVPTIGLYTDKKLVESKWAALRARVTAPLTDLEFYPILKEAIAAVEEGHIFISGWNDEDSHVYQRMARDKAALMPIQMRVLHDGLYVWQNRSHVELAPERGERVISINGESADYLVDKFANIINVDAGMRNAQLDDMDLIFRVWYYLLHDQPDQFTIETVNSAGTTSSFKFEAVSLQQQNVYRVERYGAPERRPPINATNFFEKEMWKDESALYLNLFSFSGSLLLEYDVSPKAFWDSIFAEIQENNIANLVIDLRENRGGRNEFVWELLPHINQNKLAGSFSRARAYDGDDHGTKLVYNIPAYDESKVFSGNIVVLISGNTFSNGSMTAMALREFGNATIVGSESASRYQGFAASSWESYNLPNTNIPVRIPFFVTEYPVATSQDRQNRGVLPDVVIHPDINDLISDNDVVLAKARSLLLINE